MSDYTLPEQFEEYSEARRNGFIKAMEVKKNGGKIAGTFCTFTPVEVLDAAGIHPVSLCGMSDETIAIAETHLPKNLCPLIKSSYGFAISDKCPYFYFADLILGETTCDGKKKMYELLGELKFTHVMQLPQTVDSEFSYQLWDHEVRKLIKIVEEKFGVTITEEKLREAAIFRNKIRSLYSQLHSFGKLHPPAIKGREVYKVVEGAGFSFNLQEQHDKVKKLVDDIQAAYDAGERPVSPDAKRILVTGCPIGGVLDKVVSTIENNGGTVVCFENCGGVKPNRCLVDTEAEDIIDAIGKRYLSIGCSVMSPNPRRVEMMRDLLEEFDVEGVVDVTLQACHTFNVETNVMRKLVTEKGVPYMALETDYSQSDLGQIQTRLTAFIEML